MTTLDELNKRINTRITHITQMLHVYNTIASTLEPFDGKIVTKRFETICQEALPDWYVHYLKDDYNIVIQVRPAIAVKHLVERNTDWRFYIHYLKHGKEFDFEKQNWRNRILNIQAELVELKMFLHPTLQSELPILLFQRIETFRAQIAQFHSDIKPFHRINHMLNPEDYKLISKTNTLAP